MSGAAPTIGVEEEFLVVDDTGHLSYQGGALAADDTEVAGEFQRELVRCQVEVTTPICADAGEVLDRLTELRAAMAGRAAAQGLRLLPSATPVLAQADRPPITPGPRYLRMAEWFGEVAHTSNTCGCHVHVAIPDRAEGVRVINRVRAWLPVLLALSSNSPFDKGRDTAYHSWRYIQWSHWPTAGPPPVFGSLDEYESSIAGMLRTGAMMDRGMLYWDIRLSEHQPTLEFRVCDTVVAPGTAALVAALARGLVVLALNTGGDAGSPVPTQVLAANLWRAARDGLPGRSLHPVTGDLVAVWDQVRDLVELVGPDLDSAGDLDLVRAELAALRESGSGAQRQRAAHRRGGLDDVVAALAIEGVPAGSGG